VTSKTATSNGASLSSWQGRSLHTIGLPSGQMVRIRIPGIATLIEHGDLPDELLDIALLELTHDGGATGAIAQEIQEKVPREKILERLHDLGALQRALVRASVREVADPDGKFVPTELAEADVAGDALPEDDLAMIAEIVQRLRAYDARGVRIGVEPLDRWEAFREAHGCPDEDCEGCRTLVEQFSSTGMGAL
jgi:hypothetical protein